MIAPLSSVFAREMDTLFDIRRGRGIHKRGEVKQELRARGLAENLYGRHSRAAFQIAPDYAVFEDEVFAAQCRAFLQ